MPTIEEKRVYAERTGKTEAYVACRPGVVVVELSDALVGGFSLARGCSPRDVAAADGSVAVATGEAVLELVGDGFEPAGFGPAVAVGYDGGDLLAAGGDGGVARRSDGTWTAVGDVPGGVRAIDGGFVAAGSGVYRVGADGDGLAPAGLADANDVSAAGVPLAATAAGLYRLGNGWMEVLAGDARAVAADGARAHAATAGGLYAEREGEWRRIDLPVAERVRDVAQAPAATLAITADGTLLVGGGGEWSTRALGVGGVVGLAVR